MLDSQLSSRRQRVCILGATGSIGTNTLDVLSRHPEQFEVWALTGASRVDELMAQCRQWQPRYAVMPDESVAQGLRAQIADAGLRTEVLSGAQALIDVAAHPDVDVVMGAIVGAAGLPPCLAAARAGKRLLLANKESLVLAGELLMQAAHAAGATIVPIDSEHNAVFQCIAGCDDPSAVSRITLTASGGPFRGRNRAELADVTPAQAIAHPKWSMGPKISVDSATLMNKGLEVIEAHHLFALAPANIRVLVHPQSLVHAIVDFVDGSSLAQLGLPDMRTALAVGLGWPRRIQSGVGALDLLAQGGKLEFEAPDLDAFPCLALAWQALAAGGSAPAVLNAANEEAVSAFLQGRIGFLSIPDTVAATLDAMPVQPADSLDALLDADARARAVAQSRIARSTSRI